MDANLIIEIVRLQGNEDIPLPQYKTGSSVGMDVHAAIPDPVTIAPGRWEVVPCGFAIAVPDGYEAQLRPRSGLAAAKGLGLLNSPGTIDPDYRGEVKAILINLGPLPIEVTRGMRIAQLLLARVPRVTWKEVGNLDHTQRGAGGFGHTGA